MERIDGVLIIAGEVVAGAGEELTSRNPADDSIVWSGNGASDAQVDAAFAAAQRAQQRWGDAPAAERLEVAERFAAQLQRRAEELARLISREVGKPRWEAAEEVKAAIAKVAASRDALAQRRGEFDEEMGEVTGSVRYRPLGPTLVLGPFNFPAHLPGGHLVPALLAGNTAVFKPSERAAAVGQWLVGAWQAAGLPAGVLNLIQGGADVARAAIDHPALAAVMFTGSDTAGRAIHRQLAGRPEVMLALELGGNNPLVVAPPPEAADGAGIDAPWIESATGTILLSAYLTAGQRCTCARRLIVVDDPSGRAVVSRLIERIGQLRVGLPGDDPEPLIGPVISAAAAQGVLDAEARWRAAGAKSLVPLRRSDRSAALLHPGLLEWSGDVKSEDREVFGPLLQLHWAGDADAAMNRAADTRFGLAAGLIGGDRDLFERYRHRVAAGVVNWNRPMTGASGRLPFGGLGASGNHRPAGFFAADFCSDPVASMNAAGLPAVDPLPRQREEDAAR